MIIQDCPLKTCNFSIIGSKTGLREHIEDKHPLVRDYHGQKDGETLLDKLNAAENAYHENLNAELVVEANSNE